VLNPIRTFARWNTARRREAEAVRWDRTADRLAARKNEIRADALGLRDANSGGRPTEIDILWELYAKYMLAERSARDIAKTIREGR
jgi:hypothetical protein